MNLINPYALRHIVPIRSGPDYTEWHCERCTHSEIFYATQLEAGNGLTDLLKWAIQHTGMDCDQTPPPRPHIIHAHHNGTMPGPQLRAHLAAKNFERGEPTK